MKRILFIFVSLLVYNHHCFAGKLSCQDAERERAQQEYFYNNRDRQISGERFYSLDENGQREARIRNLCFGASISWFNFCSLYKYCKLCENGTCTDIPADEKIATLTFGEWCNLANTDCFTEDIDKIFSLMQSTDDSFFKMFMPNMNDVIKDILNGDEKLTMIDTDNSICYRTDDNGDTVWHAFVRSHNDNAWSWANLCASYLKFDKFSNALYNIKNKKGVSAFKEALRANDTSNELFYFLSTYAKQEGIDYNNLVNDISKSNDVSVADVKKLITK